VSNAAHEPNRATAAMSPALSVNGMLNSSEAIAASVIIIIIIIIIFVYLIDDKLYNQNQHPPRRAGHNRNCIQKR